MIYTITRGHVDLTRIASLKTKHVIQQIRLYCSGPAREEFKYCMEAPEEGCVLSFQLQKKRIFSSKVDVKFIVQIKTNLLFIVQGPGFSDFGTARRGSGICLHL